MQYPEEIIRQVWEKADAVKGTDPRFARQDACGAWIKWNRYGRSDSSFGWEIDALRADWEGGPHDVLNLRPLHSKNRATKENGVLTCPVQAKGTKNAVVKKQERFERHRFLT